MKQYYTALKKKKKFFVGKRTFCHSIFCGIVAVNNNYTSFVCFVGAYLRGHLHYQNVQAKHGIVCLHLAIPRRKRAALSSATVEYGSHSIVFHLFSGTQSFGLDA